MGKSPLVTIGLPVFNGGQFLRPLLDSLAAQTERRWVLVASDNASTDGTLSVLQRYASEDSRISVSRQPRNCGPAENFAIVAQDIKTPYFMWAAADDVYANGFLEDCLGLLQGNPRLGMAFSLLQNINEQGQPIRLYPELLPLSGRRSASTVLRFLRACERDGKANLVYSVYKTEVLQKAMRDYRFGTA
jgi:glycosyltransferase involved in cell wall biosynthesis